MSTTQEKPTTVVRERPILFSAPMIRALLAGTKTQTRRVVKPQPEGDGDNGGRLLGIVPGLLLGGRPHPDGAAFDVRYELDNPRSIRCPYGKPGDRLWCKETWRPQSNAGAFNEDDGSITITYAADGATRYVDDYGDVMPADWTLPKAAARGNVSPLFMPRWASRITLEIESVKVERVQDISEADARAEGFTPKACAAFLKQAAAGIEPEEAYYGEKADGTENDGWLCYEHAEKYAGKRGYIGHGLTPESDGPAFCDKCGKPLLISLSTYGIERELRIEDDPEGKEPRLFPCYGADAAIAHMIADGIGDLREEHHGRLAQIGFATAWNIINGKDAWNANPWVWALSFKLLSPSPAADPINLKAEAR